MSYMNLCMMHIRTRAPAQALSNDCGWAQLQNRLCAFSVFARVSTSIHIGGGAIRSTTPFALWQDASGDAKESPWEDLNNTHAVPCSIWDAKRIQLQLVED